MGFVRRIRERRERQRAGDRVVVSYEPCRDGDADPGEVVWGWVPYEEDATQGKDRPVLVIGRWGADVAAVPLTSKERAGDRDYLPVGTGAWDPEYRPSWANLGRVLRFGPASLRREGCALDKRTFVRVVKALRAR